MSLLDIAAIDNAMKHFIGETDSVQGVIIKGGKFDGFKALMFLRKEDRSQILYILKGMVLPFMINDAPMSMVSVEDIENAVEKVKNFVGGEIVKCNPTEVGLEHSSLTNTVHVYLKVLVVTDKGKAEYKYVIHSDGIIFDTQEGL